MSDKAALLGEQPYGSLRRELRTGDSESGATNPGRVKRDCGADRIRAEDCDARQARTGVDALI